MAWTYRQCVALTLKGTRCQLSTVSSTDPWCSTHWCAMDNLIDKTPFKRGEVDRMLRLCGKKVKGSEEREHCSNKE